MYLFTICNKSLVLGVDVCHDDDDDYYYYDDDDKLIL